VLIHQDRLFRTLFHLLGSVEDARDATQDAFLLAYQKLHTFRRDASFYSWLFRIGYNAAISRKRKSRSGQISLDGNSVGERIPDNRSETDPAASLLSEEITDQVQAAVHELPDEYREALILKEIEGLPYEEIAELFQCPIGTVRSRIHRARHLLREKLNRVVEREQK
jgi:RNA polymerase sigma-70 factor (ECF subfamily)